MAEVLQRLDRQINQGSLLLAYVAASGLVVIGLATMLDVALRTFANAPLHGLEDIVVLAIVIAIAGCLPAGMATQTNVRIRALGSVLKGAGGRWLDALGDLATFAFMAVLTWQLVAYTNDLGQRTTLILELPTRPSWIAACTLTALATAIQAVRVMLAVAAAVGARATDTDRGA